MKKIRGFTIVELLAVIVFLAILAVIFMPTAAEYPEPPAPSYACGNNQQQTAMAYLVFANDHDDRFPWQVSTNQDGAMELIENGDIVPQIKPTLACLTDAKVFVCPTDKLREAAFDKDSLERSNISYFANVDAHLASNMAKRTIVSGDRHLLANSKPVGPGLSVYTNGMTMSWSQELHQNRGATPVGALSFVDGHVAVIRVKWNELTGAFFKQGMSSARLVVP